jgi:multidrug efflux system membrane fusion protein
MIVAAAACSHHPAQAPGAGSAERTVAVQVARAEQKDLPIWIEGLGSVAAVQQVTVHTQVDGRLDKVFFKEGQAVKAGDVLAQVGIATSSRHRDRRRAGRQPAPDLVHDAGRLPGAAPLHT